MDRKLTYTLLGVGLVLLFIIQEMPPRLSLMIFVGYGLAWYGLYAWSNRSTERVPDYGQERVRQEPVKEYVNPHHNALDAIMRLPAAEAQAEVYARLAESSHWKRVPPSPEAPYRFPQLSDAQQDFFTRLGGIEAAFGGARLAQDVIKTFKWPSETRLSFGLKDGQADRPTIQIGIDFEGNPLVVKPDDEVVYVLRNTRQNADKWLSVEYPSLFHWLLVAEFKMGH